MLATLGKIQGCVVFKVMVTLVEGQADSVTAKHRQIYWQAIFSGIVGIYIYIVYIVV